MDHLTKLATLLCSLLLFTSAAGAQLGSGRSALDTNADQQHDSAVTQRQMDSPDSDSDAPADREESEEVDIVLMRNEWFYGQREYPLGYIPGGARLAALDHLDQMLAFRSSLRQEMGLPIEESSEAFGAWHSIGPEPINVSEGDGKPYSSGRVTALVVNPMNPNIVYMGAAEGGVWVTKDGGTNWTPLTDQQPSLAVGSIAVDASSCDATTCKTIYVGTGEGNNNADAYYGAGILKSTDGGATWKQYCGSTPPTPAYIGPFCGPTGKSKYTGGAYIGSLALSPTPGGPILAAVEIVSKPPNSKSGIYRSTTGPQCPELGQCWELVLPGAAGSGVVFHPTNGAIAYAALGDTDGNALNGVWVSSAAGAKGGWTRLGGTGRNTFPPGTNIGRVAMALSTPYPNEIYAGVQNLKESPPESLYSTRDAGANWKRESVPDYCQTQCDYDNVIVASPSFSRDIYVGGKGTGGGAGGGTTGSLYHGVALFGPFVWKDISAGANKVDPHVDEHALAFSGGGKLYVGNDGGVWSTKDDGLNYADLNFNLAISQFYPGLSIAQNNINRSLGGTQDNGTVRFFGAANWDYVECGDGAWTAISFSDPNRVFTGCAVTNNSKPAPVYTSLNGGIKWFLANSGIEATDRVAFIPPLVMDPSNASTLYLGTYKIFRTIAGGFGWSPVSGDLGAGKGKVSTIAVSPSDNRVVYAGTYNALVWRTGDVNAGVWIRIDSNHPPLPNRAVTQIAVDPTDPNRVLVTFSGFSVNGAVGHIFLTTDGGMNWTDITREGTALGLPNIPVNDIVIDPAHRNTFFAATDVGVFYTTDAGTRWQPLMHGLPRVAVLGLKLHSASRTLRAATHGRSAWDISIGADVPNGIMLLPADIEFGSVPVGRRVSRIISLENTGDETVNILAIRLLGQTGGENNFPFETDCGQGLAPGTGCKINVSFSPASVGDANAELVVSDDGMGSPRAVDLRGKGMLP